MSRAGFFETIVGAVVIAIAAAFLAYAYGVSGKGIGRDQYRIAAVFGRVDGVTVGSEVRIAGVKVGAVSANSLDSRTYEANVEFAIDGNVEIPEDSIAKVVSDGLLGGAHIAIEPGASEEMLRAGDKITITQGSVDLLGLAVQAFTNQAASDGDKAGDNANADPLGEF
ncbi:outer membrane lipid asymmetry maintenance protein MlaD [Hyphococcus luteus]|uniref:Outer membrane lipid asymmetry maintenance protein MlaD n=1 Tax=Hyphococcus luteus TaxID=2058213 RepID=A0A2S7K967_9PROT|nr:outer membrane lipid asymmetry maintenance protein MlaD [Marinicaulis flavus]PQA89028.1 outer membrane lipid asymmetry maintenance protein MlaD [Marinicaulis flavus]